MAHEVNPDVNPVAERLRAIARLQPIGPARQFEQRPRPHQKDAEVKRAANKAYNERMKKQRGKA